MATAWPCTENLNILAIRAPWPAVGRVPLIARCGAATVARGGQWIAFFVKFNRRVGRVVIRAELARVAPHTIGTGRKTIK